MKDDLLGTWKANLGGMILYLTLNEDGTCVTAKEGAEMPGKWSLDGKVLVLDDQDGPSNRLTILKSDKDSFSVSLQHGPDVTLVRSEPPAKAKPPAPIWQLGINWGGCEMSATLNGFPVGECSGASGFATQPINPWLIGKGNVLEIQVTGGDASKATVSGKIEIAQQGDIVDTSSKGGDFTIDKPGSITFDSDLAPFAGVLKGAKKHDKPDAAIEFGMAVVALAEKKDANGIIELFSPKADLYAEAMGGSPDMMKEQFMGFLQEGLFADGLEPCAKKDVEARAYCDGRVWEIRRKNGQPLIRTKEKDGGYSSLPLFGADMGDGFKSVC